MQTRLAQLIAQAATPDGKIDRGRLLDALSTTPDDPVYLVVESALQVELGLARQRSQDAAQATQLAGVFASHAEQFKTVLSDHVGKMEGVTERLAILTEELSVARADARTKLEHDAAALRAAGETLAARAAELRTETERQARRTALISLGGLELHGPDNALVRSLVILLAGFFAGVSVVLIYFLARTS